VKKKEGRGLNIRKRGSQKGARGPQGLLKLTKEGDAGWVEKNNDKKKIQGAHGDFTTQKPKVKE